MTQEESQALLDAVHGELRDSFMKSMPERIAAIQRIADGVGGPADIEVVRALHQEAHRLAGTSAVYGLALTSSVARQFNHTLLDTLHSGAELSKDAVDGFLRDLSAALTSER